MLLPRKTSGAIRANAGTATKAERAEGGRPQVGGLLLQPALDVGKGFGFRRGFGRHAVCMPHHIHTCQGKNIKMHETLFGKSRVSLISCGDLSFAPETRLGRLPRRWNGKVMVNGARQSIMTPQLDTGPYRHRTSEIVLNARRLDILGTEKGTRFVPEADSLGLGVRASLQPRARTRLELSTSQCSGVSRATGDFNRTRRIAQLASRMRGPVL
jgi:hypothetical protein